MITLSFEDETLDNELAWYYMLFAKVARFRVIKDELSRLLRFLKLLFNVSDIRIIPICLLLSAVFY